MRYHVHIKNELGHDDNIDVEADSEVEAERAAAAGPRGGDIAVVMGAYPADVLAPVAAEYHDSEVFEATQRNLSCPEQRRVLDQAEAADAMDRVQRWAANHLEGPGPGDEDWRALGRVGISPERASRMVDAYNPNVPGWQVQDARGEAGWAR